MKTTLLLLPGLNGTTGLFEPLLKHLQQHFDVIPISYPTHQEMPYLQLTSYVLEKIESVEGNFVILGESFSGPISLFLAEKNPKGLIGVVLVASFITTPNFRLGEFLPWRLGFIAAKPLYGMRLMLSTRGNKSVIAATSTELQKVSPNVLSARISEVFAVNATEALRSCRVPLMYFRGVNDFVVPKKNLKEILSVRPDVKVVEFQAQHFLLQSAPELASSEIRKFVKDCTSKCATL